MDRIAASALLGIDADADAPQVRSAWRVWARVAHPDAGGDPAHFRELVRARDVMLAGSIPEPVPMPEPEPRRRLRSVWRYPDRAAASLIAAAYVVALAISAISLVLPTWIAAGVMGALGALAASVATRFILERQADVGHRISTMAMAWLPLTLGQVVVSEALSVPVLTVLPVLVVPFAVAIALVNPGAGLWRPVSS
jgi:hypothetical protein